MLQIMLSKKNFIDEASVKALIFLLLGVLGLLLSIVQNVIFEVIGEKITRKIRSETFYKLMKLPMYWY
jgi:ABC-type bacteriocin/lantibiotic exporter with double-glycine peptidase domain